MGFKDFAARWGKKSVTQAAKDTAKNAADKADDLTNKYTPTFRAGASKVGDGAAWLNDKSKVYTPTLREAAVKAPAAAWGAAKWGVGAVGAGAAAVGGAVAGAAGVAGVGLLALHGKGTWLFVALAAVVNVLHVARNRTSFSPADPIFGLYIGLAFLAAFVFYADRSDPFPYKRLGKFLALTTFAYYLPILISWLAGQGYLPRELGAVLMFAAPLWVIYVFLDPGDGLTRILAALFFFGWMVYLVIGVFLPVISESAPGVQAVLLSPADFKAGIATGFDNIKKSFALSPKQIYNQTKSYFNGTIAVATQDYYTGSVDQAQGLPIGVFITNALPALQKFDASTDDISVYATIKARTMSDTINISNTCYLEVTSATSYSSIDKRKATGRVSPASLTVDYTGEFQDQYDIDCSIPKQRVAQVASEQRIMTGMVIFNSTFNFETWGYIPYAFMDRGLVQSLRRNAVDPAAELGIASKPTAKYTPGPMMIGMASDTQPISYTQTQAVIGGEVVGTLGFTLSNAWQGKGTIKKIGTVSIILPKPFWLQPLECSPVLSNHDPENWTENTAYDKYDFTNIKIRSTETFTTIRCPLYIDNYAINHGYPVLGTSGAGIFTFFVFANYTYTLDTKVPVTIMGTGDQTTTPSAASTGTTTQNLGAIIEGLCANHTTTPCMGGSGDRTCCSYQYNNQTWFCRYDATGIKNRVCAYLVTAGKYACQYTPTSRTCVFCDGIHDDLMCTGET